MAIRGGAFLSEHTNDTCFRYYKGGLSEATWACPGFVEG
jgi:hypothetical protein